MNPVPPVAASAGTSSRKPQGIASLTLAICAWLPNASTRTVDSQKIAISRVASVPAMGWISFDMVKLRSRSPRRDHRDGNCIASYSTYR